MWLYLPHYSKLLNLDQYSDIYIVEASKEEGFYALNVFEAGGAYDETRLIPLCSLGHAQKQLSNIIHSLSKGVKVCRVYAEDETPPQDNDDND